MQPLPGMQSLSVWHGQAHLPAGTLQRWVRQWASVVQGRASGFGVDSADDAAGAGASPGLVPFVAPGDAVGPLGAGAGARAGGGSLCLPQRVLLSAHKP
ncbi:MAG TPA: hypothetical protein VFK05_16065, partial [Polyangiaceae bacterium]|nr:hypothetical protein [Polyangiaceae bacterium]